MTTRGSARIMPKIPIDKGTASSNEVTLTLTLMFATIAYKGVVDGETLTLTHEVIEQRNTNGGQSLGAVLMSADVLTTTRAP